MLATALRIALFWFINRDATVMAPNVTSKRALIKWFFGKCILGVSVSICVFYLVVEHIYCRAAPNNEHYACLEFQGRVGNVMFQYAFLHALKRRTGATIIIPNGPILSDMFEEGSTPYEVYSCNIFCRLSAVSDEKICAYDPKVWQAPTDRYKIYHGYFQSWKYFINYEKELRQIFRIKTKFLKEGKKILETALMTHGITSLTKQQVTLVGLHVRRGDLAESMTLAKRGYVLATRRYLLHAMTFFRRRYKRTLFIVCSDGMNWTKTQLETETDVYFVEGYSPGVDMAVLSLTNHTIMTVGTFGWWSAWLTNGITLYYKHPFVHGSKLSKEFSDNQTDFFYPGWIGMD